MRRSIRIAMVISGTRQGGAERQALDLAERLPRDRFTVDLILLTGEVAYAERARQTGRHIQMLEAPERGALPWPLYAARVSGRVLRFARLIRRGRYDVVDAWLFPAYTLAAVTRPLTRVPVMVAGRRSLSGYKDRFGPVQRWLDTIARRAADAVVANSNAVEADVLARERLDPLKLRVIRNGVTIPSPPLPAERERQRAAWGATAAEIVIGCVGNFSPGKGHALLLEALEPLLRSDRAPLLVLVGQGRLRDEIEALVTRLGIASRVVVAGPTIDPLPMYWSFDIAVSASEREGLPNVLLEAAAAARPIVATDAGGSREIVRNGETGLLVPVGDAPALARAIDVLVMDAEARNRYGARARAWVSREFSMSRMVDSFAALYEELVASRADAR
jgi:glycosyltransferase involved in cell wall biosynthesis